MNHDLRDGFVMNFLHHHMSYQFWLQAGHKKLEEAQNERVSPTYKPLSLLFEAPRMAHSTPI